MVNLQALFTPSTWFEESFTYEGNGRIEFDSPKGWLEGEMRCEVDSVGHMIIKFRSERFGFNEPISEPDNNNLDELTYYTDWLLSGYKGNRTLSTSFYFPPQGQNNRITQLKLTTPDGIFTSQHIAFYINLRNSFPYQDTHFDAEITVTKAEYVVFSDKTSTLLQDKSDGVYWVIPCINLHLGENFRAIIDASKYTDLASHPLRVFPVRDEIHQFLESGASEEEKSRVSHNLVALNYLIAFMYNGKPAYIERLPNYSQIAKSLWSGERRLGVTSLMIGSVNSLTTAEKPLDLLGILGFATGRPVGAAWIEFRNKSGNLIYRVHGNMGQHNFSRGRIIIDEILHMGGLSRLLAMASQNQDLSDSRLQGILLHLSSVFSTRDLKLMRFYLYTAIDELMGFFKTNNSDYGEAVRQLIELFDLKDIEILKGLRLKLIYQDEKKEKTKKRDYIWRRRVRLNRNLTMHGTVDIEMDVFDHQEKAEQTQILLHLMDIAVRIVLKHLKYDKTYAPPQNYHRNVAESVDWVTPTTTLRELGYNQ